MNRPGRPEPIPGRGVIEGTISFATPLMQELVEKRPAPYFTVVFVEVVPQTQWNRAEAAWRGEDPYLIPRWTNEEVAEGGRYIRVFLTDRYRDAVWGMERPDEAPWVSWPASVLALELGESFKLYFPWRYVKKRGPAHMVAFPMCGENFGPGRHDGPTWQDFHHEMPLGTGPQKDGPPEVYEHGSSYTYGRLPIDSVGIVMDISPDFSQHVYIVCVQNPFHTTIDLAMGREFRIENVPPGQWHLRVFDRHFETVRVPVEVVPDQVTHIRIVIEEYRKSGVSTAAVQGLDETPTDPSDLLDRGIERRLRDPRGALEDFERALAIDPEFWRAWVAMGAVLASLRENDRSRDAFDRALDLAPPDWRQQIEAERRRMLGD